MASRLKPAEWAPIRKRILARDDNACQKCGRPTNLEVHHIVSVLKDGSNDDENLITLCWTCHREWEIVETALVTPFREWLMLPSFAHLFTIYKTQSLWRADMTSADMREAIEESFQQRKLSRHQIM